MNSFDRLNNSPKNSAFSTVGQQERRICRVMLEIKGLISMTLGLLAAYLGQVFTVYEAKNSWKNRNAIGFHFLIFVRLIVLLNPSHL